MLSLRIVVLAFSILVSAPFSHALTVEEIAQRFQELPTVKEKDLPPMKNEREPFQGVVNHEQLSAHTWVRFPFVENPGSFGFDPKGRLYVAEANRFWLGVPDLRGANELIRGDFQSITVEDRQKLYDAFPGRFPEGFFTKVADRVIRLEDRDGNGAADHRTLFSDHFNKPLDGIGFSVLAEEDAVYFTCIPSLWKMTDANEDGVADKHEVVVDGFGVRVSFIGHDLHGITRGPDGRLYFSIGDRGYHVTLSNGEVLAESGRGAIFRCESDGSGFEVFCRGLRNPQELAFDEYGNLFTFDNTGDIGDLARMVYALEGSDSGWDMAHQSAHQYVTILDWEAFHPKTSVWVAEKMFDTHNEEQPQWVYPPASHVARGPSGVTWLTGASLPKDLRNKFLVSNYRGPSENCTVLTVGIGPKGAGYTATSEEVLVQGAGVSDVELGYDGKIYLCDFGGGWSVNTKGGIHVLTSKNASEEKVGLEIAKLLEAGLKQKSVAELVALLESPDKRLRQFAQFELVARGGKGADALVQVAKDSGKPVTTRLHGVWGLGQLARQGKDASKMGAQLLTLSRDSESEIRANAARTLGSFRHGAARSRLVELLNDPSTRVQSLAAIALSRVTKPGDKEAINALYQLAERVGAAKELDPVRRHAGLSALDRVGTVEAALARLNAPQREVRLQALLFLRRHESPELARFLTDKDPLIQREAIRAIYDTSVVDSPVGNWLASMGSEAAELPRLLQRRVVAANYRGGSAENARNLVKLAGMQSLDPSVREAALHGLRLWEKQVVTDPVLGHYRPLAGSNRTMAGLGSFIESELKDLLASELPPNLAALGLKLADESGVMVDSSTLEALAKNQQLEPEVRVAALDSLVSSLGSEAKPTVSELLNDSKDVVTAAALRHGFALKINDIANVAQTAIGNGPFETARAGIEGLAKAQPAKVLSYWQERSKLRPELVLDLYLALQASKDPKLQQTAAAFLATGPNAIHQLSEVGGDPGRGELVFRNQGACLQCHKIGGEGGIQGPALTKIGERLKADKLVESLVNPNAEIAKGYGLSSIALKDGSMVMGRIPNQTKEKLTVVAMDGRKSEIPASNVASVTPPMSAMPPLGASLPPRELRDLVAYLAGRTSKSQKGGGDASSHGDEKIAK